MIQEPKLFQFRWTPQQVMLSTVFVAAIVAAFYLLYRLSAVIFILFAAIMVGTALRPAVNWLMRYGMARIYAQILVFIVILGAFVGFLLLALPPFLEQGAALSGLLSQYYNQFRELMLNSPSNILHRLGFRLPPQLQVENLVPATEAAPEVAAGVEDAADRVSQLFVSINRASRGLFTLIAILLTSFYWTLEDDRAIRSLLLLAPQSNREALRDIVDAVEEKLGGFLLGQTILALTIGSMQLVAYLLIGLPNAFVLAMIAGMMELVPMIGPALGAVPAILIAYSTAPDKIIWVLLSAAIIQFLENNLLVPRVMDKSVGVNPLITLLFLAALSSLLGLAGALLAIPIAAIVQMIMNRYVLRTDQPEVIQPQGRDYISYLRYQAQEIAQDAHKQGLNQDEDGDTEGAGLQDEIEALAGELDRILLQSTQREEATR